MFTLQFKQFWATYAQNQIRHDEMSVLAVMKEDLEVHDGTFGSPNVATDGSGEKVLVSQFSLHSVGVGMPSPPPPTPPGLLNTFMHRAIMAACATCNSFRTSDCAVWQTGPGSALSTSLRLWIMPSFWRTLSSSSTSPAGPGEQP